MNLALGELDFLQFSFHLKPWDHAPGSLIGEEMGCFQGFLPDASPYDATKGIADGYLMIAPDRPSWHSLQSLLWVE
jgi:fructose-1,6-bisphosphatase/inositol monophosphatase family enzyme